MYRMRDVLEVLLVHPGGPFWATKDSGAWTIPKGEVNAGEDPLDAARREFQEETGFAAKGPFQSLGTVKQKSGKLVSGWAFEGDCNPNDLKSNLCFIEWPQQSKRFIEIPEVDRGEWLSLVEARERILPAQRPFLVALLNLMGK